MATVKDRGVILNASYTTADAITSDQFDVLPERQGTVFYVLSTIAGTVQIKYVALNSGTSYAVTAALAVAANDLTVVNFTYQLPRSVAVFTPGSASSGTVFIESYGVG